MQHRIQHKKKKNHKKHELPNLPHLSFPDIHFKSNNTKGHHARIWFWRIMFLLIITLASIIVFVTVSKRVPSNQIGIMFTDNGRFRNYIKYIENTFAGWSWTSLDSIIIFVFLVLYTCLAILLPILLVDGHPHLNDPALFFLGGSTQLFVACVFIEFHMIYFLVRKQHKPVTIAPV